MNKKIKIIDILHSFIGVIDAQISNRVTCHADDFVAYITMPAIGVRSVNEIDFSITQYLKRL